MSVQAKRLRARALWRRGIIDELDSNSFNPLMLRSLGEGNAWDAIEASNGGEIARCYAIRYARLIVALKPRETLHKDLTPTCYSISVTRSTVAIGCTTIPRGEALRMARRLIEESKR